ncbi:hypothetical protein Cgig2_007613 [Carnegiea gigantea]|uniref:DUF4283 domain-containing protein n=1 Tax=Carnegiea gigantea TaxID=171969 RepID=A0A9Q1Q7T6_9CARY|nr:hypothetical protein Cgig2_007613 [Carnegiea gigantea]
MNGEKTPTTEEVDQLLRSTKQIKRIGNGRSLGDTTAAEGETMDMDLGSPRVPETSEERNDNILHEQTRSYRDMLQQNNPNLNMDMRTNPIWREATYEDLSEDDEPPQEDDPLCPTILLTAAEKRMLRDPWRKALIIRMFDKGIGYLQLKQRLKTKWALKGDFSLIDIGCDYYVTRFTNMDDYDHVLLNGPWMLGDNYLVIREWVPNFVPEDDVDMPPDDRTYGSWMLVQKLPRRRAHCNHGPAGNRETTGHGPIQEDQRMEPNRVSTRTDGDSNLESSGMTTNLQRQQDHGSRFRALAEIDLNCVAEATLNENLSLQEREVNNKEDSLPTLEETAGMADMAEDQDHHDLENHGDKENIPTALPEMDHIPVEPSRLVAHLGQLDTVHFGPRNAPRNLSPQVYSPPTNPPIQHNDADTEASRGSVNRPGLRAQATPPNMIGSCAFTRPTPSQPLGGHRRPTGEMTPNWVTNRGMGLD